jgi:ankyrin repeat protein
MKKDLENLFFIACEIGHFEAVKDLVQKGVDFRVGDDFGLRYSAQNGHLEIVKFLVEKGVDVGSINQALIHAQLYKHAKIIEYLESVIDNINNMKNLKNLFINACKAGQLELVKKLVEQGVDITTKNNWALRYGSRCGNLEIVKFLVESGADVRANDEPLRLAAENGHLEVVKYLLKNGANISLRWLCLGILRRYQTYCSSTIFRIFN